MDQGYVDGVLDTAAKVIASGAISANGHGNVSLRVEGEDEMYFTSAPTLHGLQPGAIARVGLDSQLREGELPPIQGAVVDMHTVLYREKPEVQCVIHTHSPYATAFAVAGRRIDVWIEALAMFGLQEGVPVAEYAPRGSPQAVANIRAALTSEGSAVLLANHGVLVYHRTPDLAIVVGGVVEEAARAAINASTIGGAVVIPEEMRAAALQRTMAFATAGTQTV